MVVPGFVAVTVGSGTHTVIFQYVGFSHYVLLFGVGALTLLVLGFGPWMWRRRIGPLVTRRRVLIGRGSA